MKNKRRTTKLVVILFYSIFLVGCFDKTEVEQKSYVIGIGLDHAEEEGKIKVTYVIVNPEVGYERSGGSSNEPPQEIVSFVANDFIMSRNMANVLIAREISYDLLKVFLVSEEFARDKDFIRWMYSATKDREIRRDTSLIVTKDSAFDYIQSHKPTVETRLHKYFEFILNRGTETGLIPDGDINKYFKITEADADLFLAAYTAIQDDQKDSSEKEKDDEYVAGDIAFEGESGNTHFIGSAVFKEGQMIGTLTGEETRLSHFVNETTPEIEALTTFPAPEDEKYRITAQIKKEKPLEVDMDLKSGKPKMDVKIPFNIEILSDPSMTNYADDQDKREKLRAFMKERIEKKYQELIRKTQEEFGTEPFGWSLQARKKFLTIPEWENFDWMKSYPDMQINIEADIRFGPFGRQGRLPSLSETRD
ncbi:hypothetical protein GCM10008967_02400 [Bacillus carboniphilus]|uniref:Ger(X)C family spore germination protein n=1 Tax=Bacillus carboniphilus TaxID=86663 RepID=A0ABP3FGJ9_9BACI